MLLSPAQRAEKFSGMDLLLMIYSAPVGGEEEQQQDQETSRQGRWGKLLRDLNNVVRRLHDDFGCAGRIEKLRALRMALASDVAMKACRLVVCPEC